MQKIGDMIGLGPVSRRLSFIVDDLPNRTVRVSRR